MILAHPVPLENEALRLEVWPQIGGKLSSIIDKADKHELLFSFPAELPVSSQYDLPYANSWYAGWDECFPAAAAGGYPRHPYSGVPVPDHGELWSLPTQATPTRDGMSFLWNGLRFGYRLTRTLSLQGPTLTADYELENLAPFEFHFVWKQHALLSMAEPAELRLPHGLPMRVVWASQSRVDPETPPREFTWPTMAEGTDLSWLADLPDHQGLKLMCQSAIDGSAVIHYPGRNRQLRITYESPESRAYWSVWLNSGGWGGQRHFAVSPSMGRFDDIRQAICDGSAGRVAALGTTRWTVRWTVEEG